MFKLIKKIFNKKKEEKPQEKASPADIAKKTQDKISASYNFVITKFQDAKNEFGDIKYKFANLLETNYNLGLRHLERGNISDAIFRFRFIKKFWPKCFDAYYQLAYCLTINKRPFAAKKVLIELLAKKPDYDPKAQILLNDINSIIMKL